MDHFINDHFTNAIQPYLQVFVLQYKSGTIEHMSVPHMQSPSSHGFLGVRSPSKLSAYRNIVFLAKSLLIAFTVLVSSQLLPGMCWQKAVSS